MIAYLRGLPGPVATMAGWSLIVVLDLVGVSLLGQQYANRPDTFAWFGGAGFEVLVVLVCLVLGARTPTRFLQVVLFLRLPAVLFLAAVGSPIDSLLFGYATSVFVVVYAAYFWHSRLTYFYAAAAAITMLLLGFIPEQIDRVIQTWFVVASLLLLMAMGLNRVVAQQERQARQDPLTRLPNRVALEAYLLVHPRPGRAMQPQALVVIDLDHFKDINDSNGHVAGDTFLRETAAVWSAALRPDDLLFRVGGDEFLLLLPRTSSNDTTLLIARLREISLGPWSYGATEWGDDESFDAAFARADRQMYEDKDRRRADS